MKFSITTVLGIIFSTSMLLTGVLDITGDLDIYEYAPFLEPYQQLNIPSLLIVLGGVLNGVFIMYPARYVGKALGDMYHLFTQSKIRLKTLQKDVKMVISWAERIKGNKLKAYAEIQEEHKKDLIGFLFSLVSTNYSNEDIETFGETSIEEHYSRELLGVEVLSTMGSSSPAFGMFGTLFGLIVMLGELDNPAQMGPGLAAALITTLYGISLAYLVFFPLSRKLRNLAQMKRFREYLLLEGVLMINENRSPFYIQDRLNSYLKREYSFDLETDDESPAQAA